MRATSSRPTGIGGIHQNWDSISEGPSPTWGGIGEVKPGSSRHTGVGRIRQLGLYLRRAHLIPTHRYWENASVLELHRRRALRNLGERRRGEPSYLGPSGPTSYNHPFLLFSPLRSLPVSSHWPRLGSREGLSRRAGDSAMIPTAYFWANRAGRVTRTDEPLTSQGRVLLGVPSSMVICLHSFNCSFSLRTSPPE